MIRLSSQIRIPSIFLLLMVLLYDIPYTRDKIGRMPSWKSVGKKLRKKLALR